MLGGVAMVVFGAGLILSNPFIRRYLSQLGVGGLAQAALPRCRKIFEAAGDVVAPGLRAVGFSSGRRRLVSRERRLLHG